MIKNECGIAYQIKKNPDGDFIVTGEFKIIENEKNGLNKSLQSAIVMVITTPTAFYSFNPFQDTIIFSDDVKVTDGFIYGRFNINLSEATAEMQGMHCNVLLTIGTHMSNIEKTMMP